MMTATLANFGTSLKRNLFTSSYAICEYNSQHYLSNILADISISTAFSRRNGTFGFLIIQSWIDMNFKKYLQNFLKLRTTKKSR